MLDTAFDSQLKIDKEDTSSHSGDEAAAATDDDCPTLEPAPELSVKLDTDGSKVEADHEVSDSDDESDTLSDSLPGNEELRPFRDDPEHVNAHILRNIQRDANTRSTCSASTTTSVAPEVIRQRVKKQFKCKEKMMQARRIRKHGEAAVQTKQRRENRYDVETSLDAGWY